MFVVQTPQGEKYMVQLTGARTYRQGALFCRRGGTLTVTRKTRDYLVKHTGQFSDFDPTVNDPVEEVLPPQFGDDQDRGGIDPADLEDLASNPPLSQAEALNLARKGHFVDQHGRKIADVDPDDLVDTGAAEANAERGDITGDDLPKPTTKGGATAQKAGAAKKAGVTVKPKAPAQEESVDATGAVEIK